MVESLGEVFSGSGPKRGTEQEATIRDLHAKIGELAVERVFFCAGWSAEPSRADCHNRPRLRVVPVPAVRAARRESFVAVLPAIG